MNSHSTLKWKSYKNDKPRLSFSAWSLRYFISCISVGEVRHVFLFFFFIFILIFLSFSVQFVEKMIFEKTYWRIHYSKWIDDVAMKKYCHKLHTTHQCMLTQMNFNYAVNYRFVRKFADFYRKEWPFLRVTICVYPCDCRYRIINLTTISF